MTWALVFCLVASPADQLGVTSGGAALGGAAVAEPPDGAAAYYNPAASVDGAAAQVALGYGRAALRFKVDNKAQGLDPARAMHLALAVPVSLGDYGRLGATFVMSMPDERILRARVVAADRPRFLMYDNRLQRVVADGALAYGNEWGALEASLAAGITVLGGAIGNGTAFYLTQAGDYKYADASVEAVLPLVAAPVVALRARYDDQWSVGFLARGPVQFDIELGTSARVQTGGLTGDVYTAVAATDFYTPLKMALGASWHPEGFALHAAVEYYRWSAAPVASADAVADIDFEGVPVILPMGAVPQPRFEDVFSPRVGGEKRFLAGPVAIDLRASLFYEPTPVARGTLYLDANRWGGAVGAGMSTQGPAWVLAEPASLDFHLLAVGLERRVFKTSGPAAARPDLEVSGYLLSGGATLTLRF